MNIQAKIQEFFKNRGEIPLFYIESGSRLWGIASPDSDFDVRGFHLQSKNQYFNFKRDRDILEKMDGDFDFVSYDLDKMFHLLAKSNPTVFEWIRADISYFNILPNWSQFKYELIQNFDFKALFYHYLSLAKGHINVMNQDKHFTYKVVFYCIRGLLSAKLASEKKIPALLITDLFYQFEEESEILKIAKNSLEKKKKSQEKEEVKDEEKQYILDKINSYLNDLENIKMEKTNDQGKLEQILTAYSFKLKSKFYK